MLAAIDANWNDLKDFANASGNDCQKAHRAGYVFTKVILAVYSVKQLGDGAVSMSQAIIRNLGKAKSFLKLFNKLKVAKLSYKTITTINDISFKDNDGIIDVIVHAKNGGYVVLIDKAETIINEQDLADILRANILVTNKIRLLSCSNLESAKELSKLLLNYEIYATEDIVRLHEDGGVSTIARGSVAQNWRKLKNGIDIGVAPVPVPPTGTAVNRYVVMGGGSGSWTGTIYIGDGSDSNTTWGNEDLEYPKMKNSVVENLQPSSTYIVDGYTFNTDASSRVVKVEGTLDLNNGVRPRLTQGYQHKIDQQNKISGDDGGHLIANQFKGPHETINIVPMRDDLNRNIRGDGAWRKMEMKWADALQGRGAYTTRQTVTVEINITYGTDKRPVSFEVEYTIGTNIPIIEQFIN